MRHVWMVLLMLCTVAGLAWSQSLTETAGAIAGGSIGGLSGKKVGQGVSTVLQKVDMVAGKAAKTGKAQETPVQKAPDTRSGTVLQVGPGGVIKDHSLVPPPPPVRRAAVAVPPPPPPPPLLALIQPIPVLPPRPVVTPDDLRALASGASRVDVLKLGAPASRITMYDDGHLLEIYNYQAQDNTFGVVRLKDGSVSSVQLR
jgi:hypothetical protein